MASNLKELVEPVPETMLEGKSDKEAFEISRGYRAFTRLKEQESALSTQAYLKCAPVEQKIAKPHRRVPTGGHKEIIKVVVPKALAQLGKGKLAARTATELSHSSGLSPKRVHVGDGVAYSVNKREDLSTVELKGPVKNPSPSERIALLYTPTANVRTTGRNDIMKSYDYQISFRNMEPPPPPASDLKSTHKGVAGKDPALSHFLPLEEFDNAEFELHTPQEWIALGETTNGTPARSRFHTGDSTEEQWAPCRVIRFDETTNSFELIWNHSGRRKMAKRLNIIFDEEDETVWLERVERATELRGAAESAVRLHLYVESINDSVITPADEEQIDRILGLVASEFPLHHLHVVEKCIAEMREMYKYGLKKAVHDYQFRDPDEQTRLKPLCLPQPTPQEIPSIDTLLGTIDTPSPNFVASRSFITENLFQTHALLYDTLHSIHVRWHQFETGLLCDTRLKGITLPCELGVFEDAQNKCGGFISDRLREDWSSNVNTTIQNDLDTHFNFYEENLARFQSSRMFRFFRMVNITMSSQLRQLLVSTIKCYTDFLGRFRVVLPGDFDHEADVVDELENDQAERLYWEGVAEEVNDRRLKEKLLKEAQKETGGKKKKKQQQQQQVEEGDQSLVDGSAVGGPEQPALEFEFVRNSKPYSRRIVSCTSDPNGFQPLFVVRLISNGDAVMFSPLLEEVEDKVKSVFDNFFTYSDNIKGIGDGLFPLLALSPFILRPLEHQEPVVVSAKEEIHQILQQNLVGPMQLQQMYQSFEYILKIDIDSLVESMSTRKPPPTLNDYDITLERLKRDSDRIRSRTLNEVKFELIKVECDGIKNSLLSKAANVSRAIMDLLASQLNEETIQVSTKFKEIFQRIGFDPQTPEELQELKVFIDGVPDQVNKLNEVFARITEGNNLLLKYKYLNQYDDFVAYWEAFEWPKKVQQQLEDSEFRCKEFRNTFQQELRENCDKLTEDINTLASQVEAFSRVGDETRADEYYEYSKNLDKKLKQYNADIIKYNSREALFGLPTTQWQHIKEIKANFEPFYFLWEVASTFNAESERWLNAFIPTLVPRDIDTQVTEWSKKINAVGKKIKEDAPAEVVRKVKDNIERFKPNVPLIYALRSNLQASHWKMIFQICGVDRAQQGTGNESRPLNDYIKMGMLDHITQIESIAHTAKKTYELETELTGMENEWKKLMFEMEPFLDTYKLKASEIMQQVLDENILKTQSILGKPILRQAQNVQTRAQLWAKQLDNIQCTLDEWFKCQNTWAYLEPIFSSADIARSLPQEKQMFTVIDESWHKIMDTTRQTPQVIARCQDETLLKTLSDSNLNLDHIQRKLQQFLETKRMSFPRFYFISNEELLQILSNSKDPYLVQPYLSKCFEGIKRIHFQDSLDITAMESPEGEVVQLIKKVNPSDHSNMVELWLLAVENVMADSIRDHLRRARDDYPNRKRTEFIRHWPGQVVIAICSVYWTMEATEAMMSEGSAGLATYNDKCNQQLDDLIFLVRDRDLKPVERCTLEALVVIEVHARDIITELSDKGVETPNAFDWLAQLRYYWEDGNLNVCQINASLRYGYEYLGNTGRLVITQLTDRCYRTLMGALHLNYGGAPEGPAGTGKTETTKDLAKALGKYCVVYNCSDQITSKDMARLFKGLSQSGSWGCFDEFNRIEVQVLSVIAQQVATIQDAIAQKRMEFIFDGAQIKLKMGCAVFITMNPGYAGRAELPDNLKALFRPVAMMVPNYAMIGQIQLYSYGFLNGKVLAEKIVATYKLCSEQLSSQDHYDYGMRAVKSVLTAAGRLKRQYPDEDEMILMLRSIQDVNLPKFLAQDVELFKGIISDLFPGVTLPAPDYEAMTIALEAVCKAANVQLTEYFALKVFQTYEMIVVRHGMMLVGLSFGGKTKVLQCLSKSLTIMQQQKLEERTRLITMNPKAITMGQLYGKVDQSGEWNDGVLSKAFRTAAAETTPDRKWLVLDGPVDAVWIENMNTVLDDNKKLCLQNGDIIPMSKSMNMIFEVADLAHASPATVSRCGMVYVEPDTLGWRCLIVSYLNTIPEQLRNNETYMNHINSMIDAFMLTMLEFVRKNTVTAIQQGAMVSVASFIRLFNCFVKEFEAEDGSSKDLEEKDVLARLEGWFLFSLTWTVGGCLYLKDRISFNATLVEAINHIASAGGFKFTIPLPDAKKSFFDVCFEWSKEYKFVDWLDTVPEFVIPEGSEYQDVIVPTGDTARYTYLMRTCIENMQPALLVGDTGTGKTIMMKSLLVSLSKDLYQLTLIQFSAQTSCNDAQKLIDGRCEKRRKGVYGPPIGKKMMVFVDDVNMPQLEEYGAQPPIELLRQYLDHGGWYNHTKDNVDFRDVVECLILCAMGPPGGGRNPITQRFTRHFNSIAVPAFDDVTLKKIFGTLLDWILTKGFPSSMRILSQSIVAATVELYETLVEKLKPTPEKSHYTFNLRDVSKVFQGVSMANPLKIQDPRKLFLLWTHEISRAFADRFVDKKDTDWFIDVASELMQKHFKMSYKAVVTNEEAVIFSDLQNEQGLYEEVENIAEARKTLEEKLSAFNSSVRSGAMDLVIFGYVIEHVCRISRILKQPSGNALLIGVGGSGRHSCTRLAAYLQEYEYITVTMSKDYKRSDFWDDIRRILLKTGQNGFAVAFTLSDTQISDETFLEDICNLLNTGEVPGIWDSKADKEVLESACASLRDVARELGRVESAESFQALFVERCKKYLHICLCFSPVGKTLRDRLRKFPSLVNCTTIDWFREWPEEGLRNVATRFLEELDLTDELRSNIRDCFVMFQTQVRTLGVSYLEEARQYTYVTPTSYLELLSTFANLLQKKRDDLTSSRLRYDNGLEQLRKTEEQVELMKHELALMLPELAKKQKITDELIIQVEKESKAAEATRAIVAVDEAAANEQAAAAKKIKDESQAKVEEAQPLVEQAERAVQDLDPKALQEVKALKAPPVGVKYVIEVVCTLLGGQYKPKPVRDPQTGKMSVPYWDHAKSVLLTGEFKSILLQAYPVIVDTAPEEQIEEVKEKMKDDMFKPENIKKASVALVGVAMYVRAVVEYYKQNKIIKPLLAQSAVAQREFDVAMASLKVKKEELRIVDEKLAKQRAQLDQVKNDKQALENKVADTETKLTRAKKLIEGLGGEKARYMLESTRYANEFKNVVGDVVVSSGVVAYLGPFLNKYRQVAVNDWVQMCKDRKIQGSPQFSLEKFLGNPISIQEWKLQNLPSDNFSVDNSIIMTNSQRWPLLVDPQQQANKWIRNMERANKLLVVRPTEDGYARRIAHAIREGRPVLLENVLEDIDPTLENLLLKRLIKEGNTYTIVVDEAVEWNDKFRFYITTKLPRPHYRPEVSTKVTIINFMITQGGLQDQLLQKVMLSERKEMEEKKQIMTIEAANNKAGLKRTEDTILAILSAEGNILESETAIEELDRSKIQSDKIAKRQEEIDAMEKIMTKTRVQFVPAANLGASLFFCVTELANIDPMYQYSLQFYIALFQAALIDSEKSEEIPERISNIRSTFQASLYVKICRSLFAKDQLLFSFIMCLKIFEVDAVETRWLLMGGFERDKDLTANPCKRWLPDLNWKMIWRASTQLPAFSKLTTLVVENQEFLREFYESTDPLSLTMPAVFEQFQEIQRLVLIRCLRTDKIVPAVTHYVAQKLSKFYVEPPLVNLESITEELVGDSSVPIIFVLSPGADPNAELDRVAEIKGMAGKRIFKLSLGQGQDVPAKQLIEDGKKQGLWILLQNCHLYKDFMPELARIIEDYSREDIKETLHRDFRLWLTSLPSEDFPVAVLQNGAKLVQEPPKGLKSNMLRSYMSDPIADAKFFYSCNKPEIWRKMLFGLCFFHSLVQERRKFGPLGWNRPYEFNDTDMRISVRQLHMFINDNAEVPYEALVYLTGHCNYGGRVTDDWDRRCLLATLSLFYTPTILEDDYRFALDTPEYYAPKHGEHDTYLQYIQNLPMNQRPGIFGLHANADITKDERDARLLMDATLATQPREASGGSSSALDPKTIVLQIAKEVHSRLPNLFDTEFVQDKYPILYSQSMNTVLLQELIRYNRLLAIVRKSLSEVQKAIRGEVVMSSDLEQVFNAIYDSKTPEGWKKRSFPSLKPFGSYIEDLVARLTFLQKWIDNGPPSVFWLSGFFFTQSFLTGIMQNFARKYHIEIDKLDWKFTVMHEADYPEAPADGCYINGLFLEGAGWDHGNKLLCESKPKELFVTFPIMYLLPCKPEDRGNAPVYNCPAYKTTDRRGVLSTTGHSTNFIMPMHLPRHQADTENHWVLRGTALFTQLEY